MSRGWFVSNQIKMQLFPLTFTLQYCGFTTQMQKALENARAKEENGVTILFNS